MKMKKRPLEPLRILLKISLLFGLAYNVNYKAAEAKENSGLQQSLNGKGLTLDERMSRIEEENSQHKTEISLLKSVVEEDKKAIATLTIKVDEEHATVSYLKTQVARLEKSALYNLAVNESFESSTISSKTRKKRGEGNLEIAKLLVKKCADSSRLCTFYYPDHPDALRARNSISSQNKNFLNSGSSSGRQGINEQCLESSRLCTFAHPDHPNALSPINSTILSHNQTLNSVTNESNPKDIISGNINTCSKTEDDSKTGIKFYGPPTNCSELEKLGYTLNGYYLVKNNNPSNRNKIVTVYCAFRLAQELKINQDLQTTIGFVEVKTRPVYFHARMTENCGGGILPFKSRGVNIGGALNEWDFTAPVAGTYHFDFFGSVLNASSDFKMCTSINSYAIEYIYLKCANCSTQLLYFAATYHLNAGDRFWLFKYGDTSGTVVGGGQYEPHSKFAGWLVEED